MWACVTITRDTSLMAYPAPSRPASMAASPPSGRSGRQTPQSTTVTLSPSARMYMLTLSMAFTPIGNATRVTPGIESRGDWLTGRLPARSARLWLAPGSLRSSAPTRLRCSLPRARGRPRGAPAMLARLRLRSSVQAFQEGEPHLQLHLVGRRRFSNHPRDSLHLKVCDALQGFPGTVEGFGDSVLDGLAATGQVNCLLHRHDHHDWGWHAMAAQCGMAFPLGGSCPILSGMQMSHPAASDQRSFA